LLGLLLVISQTDLWRHHTGVAVAVLALSLLMFAIWARLEMRVQDPLVDLRLLRHPAVAAANLVMLIGGVGMYLLLSLITRYVQTPSVAGYGFGLDAFEAGLVLVPFSLLGFAAGRLMPLVRRRVGAPTLLAASTGVILAAFLLFALARDHLAEPVIAMSLLGLGVGTFSAVMPAVILSATPQSETASAMGVNQVVRSVGFSIGSALGGLILDSSTSVVFPHETGYTTAAWTGIATTATTLLIILALGRVAGRRPVRR
jgi:predicted MFS family arabinose efflux permease